MSIAVGPLTPAAMDGSGFRVGPTDETRWHENAGYTQVASRKAMMSASIGMLQQLAIRARPVGNYLYEEARVADRTARVGARWSVLCLSPSLSAKSRVAPPIRGTRAPATR
jgi:hypothetical protein